MLFEGIYLYLMVVKVFNTVIRMRLVYSLAWGKCFASYELVYVSPVLFKKCMLSELKGIYRNHWLSFCTNRGKICWKKQSEETHSTVRRALPWPHNKLLLAT